MLDLGDTSRGLRVLEEGLAAQTITRSALLRPYYFVLLAGALLAVREFSRAQRALDDARAVAIATSQNAYAAEHARVQAELLRVQGRGPEAECFYVDAITAARVQGALWLELRAGRAFAEFLTADGRIDEARRVLAEALAKVRKGQTTPDYVKAEALLATL